MDPMNIFPLASVWVVANSFLADTVSDPSVTGLVMQYGLPTLLLGVLAKFTFWQEKQRNSRDAKAAQERKDYLDVIKKDHKDDLDMLREENRAKNVLLKEMTDWMRNKIDESNKPQE